MKKKLVLFMALMTIISCSATENGNPSSAQAEGNGTYFNGKKVLVAYFSWGGTTRRMAEAIRDVTGGYVFEIEPVEPYPSQYTPCTEVAREERDKDMRPAIKGRVTDWDKYDVIFIGCPVWWHTAPMIISTFAESYDFTGKTVIPFCTYAATYRDETLQKIVSLTPDASHLEGFGTTGSTSGVRAWVERINGQWNSTSAIGEIPADARSVAAVYDLNGRQTCHNSSGSNIYIVKTENKTQKIFGQP